uniref:CHK domain-containing protein n=1 Tax=Steinernema glaseri TaxID=37863 RepID=A0A1I8AHS8_9BILA
MTSSAIRVSSRFTSPSVNISDHLSDSPFTVEWLLGSLYASNEKFRNTTLKSRVQSVNAVNIGGSTMGLLSQVYDIVFTFENSNEEYRILMKVPGMESLDALKKRSGQFSREFLKLVKVTKNQMFQKAGALTDSFASEAHTRECAFYRDYAPHLPELPLVEKAGVLPIWDTATESQMFAFAKHLSYLYAHFLCLPPETWLGKYPRNYLTYFVTSDFYYLYVDKLCALKPGMFEEAYRVFRPYMASKKFYDYTMTDVYKDIGLPPVLVHGDIWHGNLLWSKNADSSLSSKLSAVIDWQLFHEGSVAFDIASFLALCVDGEIRREYEYQVLKFLYDRIGQLMEERGKSVNFSYDQMKQAYQVNFIPRALQLMVVPGYLLSYNVALDEEARVVGTRREQYFSRIKFAMEDALEYFKQVRKDRIEEKAP